MSVRSIAPTVSVETIQTLEALLEMARRGHVIGIAYVTIAKHQRWGRGTAGPVRNDPMTVGALHVLMQELIGGMAP